jgi:hypothetical protein
MTFDPADLSHHSSPRCTSIANANGVVSPITRAGSMTLSPSLQLSNTLLVPSLSHKLLSVSQITTYLNCVVLIFADFCLIPDIFTKKIIGRGAKKGGLYYMEDFNVGRAHHRSSSLSSKTRQIWLWHRHLGHPSFKYLRNLFPNLFSDVETSELNLGLLIL